MARPVAGEARPNLDAPVLLGVEDPELAPSRPKLLPALDMPGTVLPASLFAPIAFVPFTARCVGVPGPSEDREEP